MRARLASVAQTGSCEQSAALDYESKTSYSVTINVSDGNGGTDTISVTINIIDVDEDRAPVFTEGNSATRSIAENTGSGVNIGSAVSATDADNDDLTHTLGGTDAGSLASVAQTGSCEQVQPLTMKARHPIQLQSTSLMAMVALTRSASLSIL